MLSQSGMLALRYRISAVHRTLWFLSNGPHANAWRLSNPHPLSASRPYGRVSGPCYTPNTLEPASPMTVLRQYLALFAICALLVVTTVSVLPGHEHGGGDDARPCDICHSGHLPCLQASGQIQLYAHAPVICPLALEDFERYLDSASVIRTPRAPP